MTEYLAYVNYVGLDDPEQRITLLDVVSQVDAVLLADSYEEMEKSNR